MNKIERMIINQTKRIAINAALDEITKLKAQLSELERGGEFKIDLFNTGITVNIRKLQRKGLEAVEKKLLEFKIRGKKDEKTG